MVFVSAHLLLHHVWPFSSRFHSPVQKRDTEGEEPGELSKRKKDREKGERGRERGGKRKGRREGKRNKQRPSSPE